MYVQVSFPVAREVDMIWPARGESPGRGAVIGDDGIGAALEVLGAVGGG